MGQTSERMCVLLPLGRELRWAVPQNSLAELVTLSGHTELPPSIDWRDQRVPVLDFARAGDPPWLNQHSQTGLVAVFLGLRGQSPEYWAVALRGEGVGVRSLDFAGCTEVASDAEFLLAAFETGGELYQLPDLPALQAYCCQVVAQATA